MTSRLDPITWNLRRWLLIASALVMVLTLAACGGGEATEEDLAGPPAPGAWNCWMQPAPCDPASSPAPSTRLIDPPRDTRTL